MKNHVFTKRKGLSTVLTTVIILVASVVLGSGVVLYGTSMFQTVAQQENIETHGIQLWVNATDAAGDAWGAAGVRNDGDKILSVDTIRIKGSTVPFASWYYDADQTRVSVGNFQSQFIHEGSGGSGTLMNDSASVDAIACANPATTISMDFDGGDTGEPTLCLSQGSGPIGLNPGERTIIYFHMPDGTLTTLDAGGSTTLNVFAGEAGAPLSTIISNP